MPKVSIIMPTFNDSNYISVAINSVLSQTFQDWELIIVDDGSHDNTGDIAREYAAKDSRIIVLVQENQGTVNAKNNGIKFAKGEYILPLDADDMLLPKCVEILYNKIYKSEYSVVAPSFASFGLRNSFDDRARPTWYNMCVGCMIVNTSMYKKSDWEKYGGYDLDFKEGMEDYAFWMNFIMDGKKIHRVPELLFYFRVKNNDESRQRKAEKVREKLTVLMFKKYPKMKIVRKLNKIIGVKRTSKLNIIRFFKIPLFVLPRPESKKYIKLNYFSGRPNFGDMLNISIVRDLFGFEVKKAPAKYSKAVFIGSMMQTYLLQKMHIIKILRKYLCTPVKVWGTGFIESEKDAVNISRRFDVRAVRGKYTLERLRKYTGKKLKNVPLGDPGLLVSSLIDTSKIEKKYDLGIILHYVDENNPLLDKIKVNNSIAIDIHLPAYDFLQKIASCKVIASSAMHGLIAADSLGIPNARLILSDKVVGGDYKFNDYYSAFGLSSHTKINLNEIDEFNDLNFIKNNYLIKSEQVLEIKENLIKAFPYNKVKK